ncbi:hypothetical protein [Rhodopirellula baltica]|nr:hypothetical protein [Rhodopirellula baltica]
MYRRTFQLDGFRSLNVFEDTQHDVDSADNVNSYNRTHLIPSRVAHVYFSNRGLTLQLADGTSHSALVRFPDGGRLGDSKILMHGDRLYMAGGTAVCCIDATNLDLLWSVDLLTGADNGLLVPASDDCIFAIGDFDASCIQLDGSIRWATQTNAVLGSQASCGADSVDVYDENGLKHSFDIATGNVTPAM